MRSWPVGVYLALFALVMLVPATLLVVGHTRAALTIEADARAKAQHQAAAELRRELDRLAVELAVETRNLASGSKTLTISGSAPVGKQRQTGRQPFRYVTYYDAKGRPLTDRALSFALARNAIEAARVYYRDGDAFLVHVWPVYRERPRRKPAGYVAVSANIKPILIANESISRFSPTDIRWRLAADTIVSVDDAIAGADLGVAQAQEIVAFRELAARGSSQHLVYLGIVLALLAILLSFSIARPLRRLARDLNAERIAGSSPGYLSVPLRIAELEDVRKAVCDYRQRFDRASETLMEKNEEVLVLTFRDSLTGIYNRHAFETHAQRVLEAATQDGSRHALCYIDLDQFKIINDTCSHAAGDELLKQVATRLRAEIPESGMVARLGGDEFAVLLSNCGQIKAANMAESVRHSLKQFRFCWEGKVFGVSASVGLVLIDADSGNLSDLMSAADAACYVAKDRGRDRVHIYQPDDRDFARHYGEMQWVTRITKALEENRFELYCQRITPLSDRTLTPHFEILLRMHDGEGADIVSPAAFIPAAERYSLATRLDRWVVQRVLYALQKRAEAGSVPAVSINLSGQSLGDAEFLEFVSRSLDRPHLDPRLITFEITETAAITNLAGATRFVDTLRDRGCKFALDDFGSGLSSFAYLKNLCVDYLKIDGHFVRQMADDPISRSMVEAINHVGHVMGIRTIGEYAENEQILQCLKDVGVDYAQGHAIGYPAPFATLAVT